MNDAAPPARSGPFTDALLDQCIACGFCLPACPTYGLTAEEASSPRGRITLMQAVRQGELAVDDPDVLEQSSFCLGCRACEVVCPAGVRYGALLEEWRDAAWVGRHRPLQVRALLVAARHTWALAALGTVRFAAATRRRRDGPHLLLGCFERLLFPAVSRAARRVHRSLSAPAIQGCCGALHAHNGEAATGRRMAERVGRQLPGQIVTTSGGCAAHLADVLGRARVVDISQLVEASQLRPLTTEGRRLQVALQDSCHLRNGLDVWREPRALLARIGDYVEVPGADACCGSAGTYSMLRPADSERILEPKLDALESAGVDVVATVNPGCLRQLRRGLRRRRSPVKAVHLVELVARALKQAPKSQEIH